MQPSVEKYNISNEVIGKSLGVG